MDLKLYLIFSRKTFGHIDEQNKEKFNIIYTYDKFDDFDDEDDPDDDLNF